MFLAGLRPFYMSGSRLRKCKSINRYFIATLLSIMEDLACRPDVHVKGEDII